MITMMQWPLNLDDVVFLNSQSANISTLGIAAIGDQKTFSATVSFVPETSLGNIFSSAH